MTTQSVEMNVLASQTWDIATPSSSSLWRDEYFVQGVSPNHHSPLQPTIFLFPLSPMKVSLLLADPRPFLPACFMKDKFIEALVLIEFLIRYLVSCLVSASQRQNYPPPPNPAKRIQCMCCVWLICFRFSVQQGDFDIRLLCGYL